MAILTGKHIKLRALEPNDLDFLFETENDESLWEISGVQTPFSKNILKIYIENAHLDIYAAKQFRFVICDLNNSVIGLIDLYDFNPQHKRVGIGILILPKYQSMGFGKEALSLIINYCKNYLNLHQVYASILSENLISISLFEHFNFKKSGEKKDWIFNNGGYKDEYLYQLILSNKNE
ncbi:GNAT family N-acetyltransferase [Lutibacter sp.]|uniref:GNAT family N-acetyltransferase n=1 Tax=Lutibacter sp. TaxID=1925666 RepID=UPI00273489D8|nr:GNAT family N-acetyltransferase [Lutibacter sp.]MDP3312978.1 GNAT family N-acetyltransferase [Lutibacter sp.]